MSIPKIETDDILAIFVGIFGSLALFVLAFLIPDVSQIVVGALITNVATVIQHFFGKVKQEVANGSPG